MPGFSRRLLFFVRYLHLIDNITGADVDLLSAGDRGSESAMRAEGSSYTFNARTTDYESRFKLVFVANENDNENGALAFFSNGNWIIANEGQATLQVIDVTGLEDSDAPLGRGIVVLLGLGAAYAMKKRRKE